MSRNVNSFLLTHLISSLYFFLVVFTARDLIPCSNAQTVSYIRIPALGRISNLGFLYDERTDTFRDSSIFRHDIPADAITETHSPITTTDIPLRNTFDEVSHIFESDMNTGVNILTGSTKPKGASSIIISMSQFTVTGRASVTMVDTYQTVVQQLQSFYDGLKSSYNTDLFQHRLATHIVTGVTWGARVAVNLQSTGTSNLQDADHILDEMNTELLNLKSGNLQTGAENSNFTIFIKADTPLPSPLPTTMKHVQKFLFQIPEHLKSLNGGKGVPLEFRLTPISVIRDHLKLDRKIDNPVHKIPSSILRHFTSIYMGYIEYEKHITDLSNRLFSQLNCALPEAIRRIQDLISDFYESKSLLSDTLKETMVQVRSGIQPVSVLYDLAQQYRRGNFSLKSFQNTVPEFDMALKKIDFCNRIQNKNSDIEFFGVDQSLISRISENSDKTIYVLFTKTEFNQRNPVRFVENLNTFLKGLNGTTEEISQFIVDCDFEQPFFCSNLTDTAIHEYKNGKLTSTDFKHTVLEKKNDMQVEINNLKNVTAHLLLLHEDQNEIKTKCSQDTCLNGGECIDEVGGYTCVCRLPWAGQTCQHKLDPCKVNQCQNEATCFPSSNYLQYACSCAPGYNGTLCEFDFGQCSRNSSLCLNGGTCHSTNGSYTCNCAPGFDGVNCARDIVDDCAGSDLCKNGGTCIDNINSYNCVCAVGFEGKTCSKPDGYSACSTLARSSRSAMTVVSAGGCGGLVTIPNFPTAPSSFLYEYKPNTSHIEKERCIWTLDQTKDGIFYSIRVKVTLLCGDMVDSEGALSVLSMEYGSWNLSRKKLAQKDEYYESKSYPADWKLLLNYDPSKRHESRFLALITVLATTKQTHAGSSFVFDQPSGIQSYGPFTNTDIFSLVLNPSQVNTTLTVDSFQNANPTNKTCSFGNGDVFDIYEIPTESPPNRLDRFCHALPSARSYSMEHPFVILTIPHTQKNSTRFQVSWK